MQTWQKWLAGTLSVCGMGIASFSGRICTSEGVVGHVGLCPPCAHSKFVNSGADQTEPATIPLHGPGTILKIIVSISLLKMV